MYQHSGTLWTYSVADRTSSELHILGPSLEALHFLRGDLHAYKFFYIFQIPESLLGDTINEEIEMQI